MAAAVWTCLVRIRSNDEERSHLIEKTTFNIGRTEDADLPLTEPSVSRSHLSVELRGPNVFVTDLKSGNGTLINGKRVEGGVAIPLAAGDVVKLGLAPHEFTIISIPKPFELLDVDAKQKSMTSSMQDVAVQAERRAKEAIASEKAKLQADFDTERSKLRAEIELERTGLRSEAEAERSKFKTDLETERASLRAALDDERSALRSSLDVERVSLKTDFDTERAALRSELEAERSGLRAEFEKERASFAASSSADRTTLENERAELKMQTDRIIGEARREAETLKTQALIELQTRKATLETEIATLKQQAAVTAAQERLKYAKDADQFMTEAQKKIAKDYEDASMHIEQQVQAGQEKAFALLQDAESRSRLTLQEAQDEAAAVRTKATEEARALHQDALKKHSLTLSQLQDKFQSDMAAKREEVLVNARQDAERERAKFNADGAREKKALEDQIAMLKNELNPLVEKRDATVKALKELDELTTQARRELANNSKEVDAVRALVKRKDEVTKETANAESALEAITKKLASAQATVDREMSEMRQKALLAFESEKKGSTDELAKQRLKALEDVQKKIQMEEKRYAETLSLRAVELAQRINAKVLPALPDLMSDSAAAGGRVKAAIEASTRDSLMNEASAFSAPTMDELGPQPATKKQKAVRKQRIAIGVAMAVVALVSFFGKDIYNASKGSQNTYAHEKMEERRVASIYHPEQDPRWNKGYTDSYWKNVLFMPGYFEAKTDSLNQQKWLLHLNNDLEQLRKMGLSEDDMVTYTSKENAMIKQMGDVRDKLDAQFVKPGEDIKAMSDLENENIVAIKKILKTDKNFQQIKAMEKDFVAQLMQK